MTPGTVLPNVPTPVVEGFYSTVGAIPPVEITIYGIIVHRGFEDILSFPVRRKEVLLHYYNISSGCCHPFSAR